MGLLPSPSSAVACLSDVTKCSELLVEGDLRQFAFFYATYARGAFQQMSRWGAARRLHGMAEVMGQEGLLRFENLTIDEFIAGFFDWPGGLSASLVDGSWTLGHRTMSHPRGLTGCEYLASYELSAIMGFDLCNPKVVTSIRAICPVSCGCRKGMAECPAACTQVH